MPTSPSECINKRLLVNSINALAFSEQINTPLTVFLTITWRRTIGFQEAELAKRLSYTVKEASRWMRRQGHPIAYIWVLEKSNTMGFHTHLGIHVPFTFVSNFRRRFPRFIQGFREGQYILHFHGDRGTNYPKYHRTETQRAGSFVYTLKGMDHRATVTINGTKRNLGDMLGIHHRGMQGRVPCKRVGVSHSLGPVRRSRTGYVDVSDPMRLREILLSDRRIAA